MVQNSKSEIKSFFYDFRKVYINAALPYNFG